MTPLRSGGRAISSLGLGTLVVMLTLASPEWPAYILWPSSTGPSSPLHFSCAVNILICQKLWVCPTGVTGQAGCNTSVQPGNWLHQPSPSSFLSHCTGGVGPPTSSVSVAIGMASFLVGPLVGAASSEDNSSEANILVGSSVGAISRVITSLGPMPWWAPSWGLFPQ